MKYFYNLLFLIFVLSVKAQDLKKENNDIIKENIVRFFNAKQADSIYEMAGIDFKKAISIDAFRSLSNNQLFPLGPIKEAVFEKYDNGISKYKTVLQAITLNMFIGLDSSNKLKTFLFQPYKQPSLTIYSKSKTDNPFLSTLDKKVDSIIQPFMFACKTVGLSIGIYQNGKIAYYNYGEIKKEAGIIPTMESLYEIGSITKTFTGLLLANAVIEEKIKLEDAVNKYLPKNIPVLKFENDTMKIVHLANHTSGLPRLPLNMLPSDNRNPYQEYSNDGLYGFLKNVKLFSKPGEISSYSNLGVGLLGVILENIYHKHFESLIKEKITSKAGMDNTFQHLPQNNFDKLLQGYTENLEPQMPWDFKALAAAGSLRSNVKDMLKYAQYQLMQNVKDKKQKEALLLSHKETYNKNGEKIALNWFWQNWGNEDVLFHGGQTGGYKSFIAINPTTKNAVVIMSNTGVSHDDEGVKLMQYLDSNKKIN